MAERRVENRYAQRTIATRPMRPCSLAIWSGNLTHDFQNQIAFVHRLLEAEVPEIKAGTVQVRAIAREPGLRTKIAVSSSEPGLDPVGACVGPKGVRHRAILSELANEQVDIVPWSEDAEALVAAALGPARADRVTIDRATRTATVLVPRGQLSLAIGRDGQNARLAAKLTGYRIDIKPSEGDDQAPAE